MAFPNSTANLALPSPAGLFLQDVSPMPMRKDFMRRFHWALARIQGKDKADKIGTGKGVRWRLQG